MMAFLSKIRLRYLTILCFSLSVVFLGCGKNSNSEQTTQTAQSWTGHEGPLAQPSATAWRFGVMADSQWMSADDGYNPNSVAVAIIKQLNDEFVKKGVKFVIQVGDLSDSGSMASIQTRALFAQPLYNAGIGFFPLRGNHDDQPANLNEYKRVFPQTQNGLQNAIPANIFTIANPDVLKQPFPSKIGSPFTIGYNFSSPSVSLCGLSYAFDYNPGNDTAAVRFIMLDQFRIADGSTTTIDAQQSWINNQLETRPTNSHAFVFGHKGLLTEAHVDTLFGSDPSQDPVGQDAFITSLSNNNVHYYIDGHDHMYDRTIITTTDGVTAKLQQLVCASDSSKFLHPSSPSNDILYDLLATTGFGHTRQTPLSQECYTIGFYIFTVDGPNITVDYYSAQISSIPVYSISTVPTLEFTKKDSFGYSLVGKEFLITQGKPYSVVTDSFNGTIAKVLNGTYYRTTLDGSGRAFAILVNTGWFPRDSYCLSNVLKLWGMQNNLGLALTNEYTLSINYDPSALTNIQIQNGSFGLATKDATGNWINAVDQNFGGSKKFILVSCAVSSF